MANVSHDNSHHVEDVAPCGAITRFGENAM